MDESLFTTRQLTEYRMWPDGRKGCLFYVAETDNPFENGRAAVFRIEAPWREGDSIGEHDHLHHKEIESICRENYIIGGFWAFLLRQECALWMNETRLLEQYWQTYCQHYYDQDEYYHWKYIQHECVYWTQRNIILMDDYLCQQKLPRTFNYDAHQMIRWKLERKRLNAFWSMKEYLPIISFADNETLLEAVYEPNSFRIVEKGTEKVLINGYLSLLINFAAAKRIINDFWKEKNLDKGLPPLINRLNQKEAIDIKDIENPFFMSAREHLQKMYIEDRLETARISFNADTNYRLDDESGQKARRYDRLLRWELEDLKINKKLYKYLNPEHLADIKQLTRDLLTSILIEIKNADKKGNIYKHAYALFLKPFPEADERKTISHCIDKDKPLQDELANTFTYTYINSDDTKTAYSLLIDTLKEECDKASDTDWARHALVLFNSSVLRNKWKSYKEWLSYFDKLFGRTQTQYSEPNKLKRSQKKSKIEIYLPLKNVG
jgi:hypothetical protein